MLFGVASKQFSLKNSAFMSTVLSAIKNIFVVFIEQYQLHTSHNCSRRHSTIFLRKYGLTFHVNHLLCLIFFRKKKKNVACFNFAWHFKG